MKEPPFCGAPGILWEEGKHNALREGALLPPPPDGLPSLPFPVPPQSFHFLRYPWIHALGIWLPMPRQIPGQVSGTAAQRALAPDPGKG